MLNLKGNNFFYTIPYRNAKFILVKTGISIIFITITSVFFVGCTSKTFETKEALWDYLKDEENGYLQQKNINGYDFSLLYKPTDLLVEQELGTDTQLNSELKKEKIKALRKKYQNQMYFTLSMSRDNKELLSTTPNNRQEFGAMVNQLAFGMREKIHLYTNKKDTLEMLDYNYPRMYGMSRSTTMLFVYPKEEPYLNQEYLNFTIQDLGTYTGEVKFKIGSERIKNQPRIQF